MANSSAPLVGLVDTAVIGHLPHAVHLAAVGVGATIFSFIFWAFGFLRMSTTGLVAQAHGQNDPNQIARIILRSALLGILLAVGLIALQAFILQGALLLLAPPTTVVPSVDLYFGIRIWAAPATLFVYSITGYLIGTARARAALGLQLVLNIANAILNLIFVLGLNMNVAGIALGSLMAEWLAAITGLIYLIRHVGAARLYSAATSQITWHINKLKPLISANGYIFARTLLLLTGFALVTREAADLGTSALAANQVLMTFLLLISLGLDAFAYAAEALTGAAFGKKSLIEFRYYVRRTTIWAMGLALLYSLVFYFAGGLIIDTLTTIESVRTEAKMVIPLIALLPIVSLWCYQYDGIFIGATEGRGMLITMAAAFTVYISVLQPLSNTWGLLGLWGALLAFAAARGIGQALYYPRIEKRLQTSLDT